MNMFYYGVIRKNKFIQKTFKIIGLYGKQKVSEKIL